MKQINGGRVKRGYEILFTPQRKALVARTQIDPTVFNGL